jgi:hypothetical protein
MQTSDPRFKENMKRIEDPMSILRRLTGYEFDWTEAYIESKGGISPWQSRHDLGFNAEQWKEVLPIATHTKEDGSLAIRPDKLVPILLEGLLYMDKQIQMLTKLAADLEARVIDMEG